MADTDRLHPLAPMTVGRTTFLVDTRRPVAALFRQGDPRPRFATWPHVTSPVVATHVQRLISDGEDGIWIVYAESQPSAHRPEGAHPVSAVHLAADGSVRWIERSPSDVPVVAGSPEARLEPLDRSMPAVVGAQPDALWLFRTWQPREDASYRGGTPPDGWNHASYLVRLPVDGPGEGMLVEHPVHAVRRGDDGALRVLLELGPPVASVRADSGWRSSGGAYAAVRGPRPLPREKIVFSRQWAIATVETFGGHDDGQTPPDRADLAATAIPVDADEGEAVAAIGDISGGYVMRAAPVYIHGIGPTDLPLDGLAGGSWPTVELDEADIEAVGRRALQLLGPRTFGRDTTTAELRGDWPETAVVVSLEHPDAPGIRLFDDAGRIALSDYTDIRLQEDIGTGRYPDASTAVDGVVDF